MKPSRCHGGARVPISRTPLAGIRGRVSGVIAGSCRRASAGGRGFERDRGWVCSRARIIIRILAAAPRRAGNARRRRGLIYVFSRLFAAIGLLGAHNRSLPVSRGRPLRTSRARTGLRNRRRDGPLRRGDGRLEHRIPGAKPMAELLEFKTEITARRRCRDVFRVAASNRGH